MVRFHKKKKTYITPAVTASAVLMASVGSYVIKLVRSRSKGPFSKLGSQVDSITRKTLRNVEVAARKTKSDMGLRPGEKAGRELDAFTRLAGDRIKGAGKDLRKNANRIDKALKHNRIKIKAK